MVAPQIPENENERLAELYKYELLDTVYEQEFQEIVQLASKICNVPISLITLVDMNRQWFKAKTGLQTAETARNISFCGHAIVNEKLFEVQDTATDQRFFDNPLVTGDPNIRYYAGMPLVTQAGYKIGTLCVIDRIPRQMDKEQNFALGVLSRQVIKLFELRLKNKELKKVTDVQQRIMTIMAHDIRGPLGSLKMSYELKNSGVLNEQESKEIDQLVPLQMESTITLLNNIVDWGKLQLSGSSAEHKEFSLYALGNECLNYFLLNAKAKNNELINTINPDFVVTGNRAGLEFVLRNLLGNANKFTSAGRITIGAATNDNSLKIIINDTGIGMGENAKASIQERTWTSTTTGTQNEKGSGMGLKLIFEYLDNIDGNIEFSSEAGKGTTVTVTIPQP